MNIIILVITTIIVSILLNYYVNETILLDKNITNNLHKFYMSVFMGIQMGIMEIFMHHDHLNINNMVVYLIIMSGALYYVYKRLQTLDFMNDQEFLLAMIEHHENAIVMVDKARPNISFKLLPFIDNIKRVQTKEIQYMKNNLNKN